MPLPEHDQWAVFPMDEDEPSVVMTNMALAEEAPHGDLPVAVCLRVPFQDLGEFGIGSDDEYEAICAEEDAASERIRAELGGVCAGRVRIEGHLDVWFYVPDGVAQAAAEIIGESMGEREHEVGAGEDPDWTVFQETLLPDSAQMQWMLDQQLVSAFEDMGDDLSVERPVRFFSTFGDQASADAFADDARGAGFETEPGVVEDEDGEEVDRIGVLATLTTAIDFDSVHAVTMAVLQLAERHGGEFDGWEAEPASAMGP